MPGDHNIAILFKTFERGQESYISAIAHGYNGVAPQAGEFRAADRRIAESLPEFLVLHFCEPVQSRID